MSNLLKILFLLSSICFSQNKIKIGEQAPSINVTDWIHNPPREKEIKNKYLVLDFWATWCKPCVETFDHLNKLQESFTNQDLVFISLTDEKVEKVKSLIRLIQINSIIVSDQSKKTQISFGNGINGLEYIPFTVLIDKNNIIKWYGNPRDLNEKILSDFIEDKLNFKKEKEENENINFNSLLKYDNDFEKYLKIVSDDEIPYFFEIKKTELEPLFPQIKVGKKMFYIESIDLFGILKNILDYNTNQIFFENDVINSQYYQITYKNNDFKTQNKEFIESEIFLSLNLNKKKEKKTIIVNEIKVFNKKKLEYSIDNFKTITKAKKKISYYGYSLKELVDEINKKSDDFYFYDGIDNRAYNFQIDVSSTKNIKDSLESFGLKIHESKKEIDVFLFF